MSNRASNTANENLPNSFLSITNSGQSIRENGPQNLGDQSERQTGHLPTRGGHRMTSNYHIGRQSGENDSMSNFSKPSTFGKSPCGQISQHIGGQSEETVISSSFNGSFTDNGNSGFLRPSQPVPKRGKFVFKSNSPSSKPRENVANLPQAVAEKSQELRMKPSSQQAWDKKSQEASATVTSSNSLKPTAMEAQNPLVKPSDAFVKPHSPCIKTERESSLNPGLSTMRPPMNLPRHAGKPRAPPASSQRSSISSSQVIVIFNFLFLFPYFSPLRLHI